MSFIDDSENNLEYLISEESTGGIAGFTGRAGRDIDALFAGPFHPDSGHGSENEKLLQKQLDDRKELRSDMEQEASEDGVELVGNPSPVGGYFNNIGETEGIELAFDELIRYGEINRDFNEKMTPEQDLEWVDVKIGLKYDEAGEAYQIRDIVYDNNPTYAGENFINKSKLNWEYIDDKGK